MKGKKKLFICDPEKNTSCKKNNCYIHNGQCNKTDKEVFKKEGLEMEKIKSTTYKIDGRANNKKTTVTLDPNVIFVLDEDNKKKTLKDYISKIVNDTINNKDKCNG